MDSSSTDEEEVELCVSCGVDTQYKKSDQQWMMQFLMTC